MIPRSVLEAGRAQRRRFTIEDSFSASQTRVYADQKAPPIYYGFLSDCQDFIEDRVFRAMLRALADEYGRAGAVATETKLLEILGEDQP
jgi:hypothetical protein